MTAPGAPPAISAIVVAYNSRATLDRCLGALAPGTPAVEAIVVDNASSDGSAALARSLGARVIASPRNQGFAAACNLGAKAARGRFLAFVNPDAAASPEALGRARELLASDPRLGVVGLPHRAAGGIDTLARPFPTLGGLLRETLTGREAGRAAAPPAPVAGAEVADWVSGSALVVARALYEDLGGMDEETFLFFDDVDLCDRVRARGLLVCALTDPAAAVDHDDRVHAKYHSRVKLYAWHRSCARYFEKRGRPRVIVRSLLALRATMRLAFWTLARALGRLDPREFAERRGGYLDVLRFCLGRAPPLPFEGAERPAA